MRFTLLDLALGIFVLAAVLVLARAIGDPAFGRGQRTLLAGLAFYLGGFLAFWAGRRSTGISFMLCGLAVVLLGAVLCGGFPG